MVIVLYRIISVEQPLLFKVSTSLFTYQWNEWVGSFLFVGLYISRSTLKHIENSNVIDTWVVFPDLSHPSNTIRAPLLAAPDITNSLEFCNKLNIFLLMNWGRLQILTSWSFFLLLSLSLALLFIHLHIIRWVDPIGRGSQVLAPFYQAS